MDLTRYDVRAAADKGASLRLRCPATNAPLGTDDAYPVIHMLGRDATAVREARKEAMRELQDGKIDEGELGLRVLIAATRAWGNIELDGKTLDCTEVNIRRLYTDPRTEWVVEQIGPFVMSRRNIAGNFATA